MNRIYTVKVQPTDLPSKIAHLTSRDFYDYFAIKYLFAKYRNVCAIPFWLYWKVHKTGEEFSIPEHYIKECINSGSNRFISIPMCLVSRKAPGGHANSLLIDVKGKQSKDFLTKNKGKTVGKGTVERFEPHGSRAYSIFKDYIYERLDIELATYFAENFGLEYIAPMSYCPALGPQTLEHYMNEDGYCATWSLWYTDMRLAYPNVKREKLVKGMFDKLHDKLTKGILDTYLLDYAKQVYSVMVSEFPQYRDFFINYDRYTDLPKGSQKKKRFDKFVKEMDNLVKVPLETNTPVVIRFKNPEPIKIQQTPTKRSNVKRSKRSSRRSNAKRTKRSSSRRSNAKRTKRSSSRRSNAKRTKRSSSRHSNAKLSKHSKRSSSRHSNAKLSKRSKRSSSRGTKRSSSRGTKRSRF